MYTAPKPPSGGSGRTRALLYGGITFALVFLLIVGMAVAYLVVRTVTAGGDPTSGPTPSTTAATTTSASATPTGEVAEERCWAPEDQGRSSTNPSGMLRGGGLQFTPPASFPDRNYSTNLHFTEDSAMAVAPAAADSDWVSTVSVGKIHWQDGIEYPGDEAAAERMTDCFIGSSWLWSEASGRTETNRTGTAVEIDGMDGYQITVDYTFAKGPSESITGYAITLVVVSTPEGPSVFLSEVPVDNAEQKQAVADALASVTGIS